MHSRHSIVGLLLVAAPLWALAGDQPLAAGIARTARLPVSGIQAVETMDGDLLFLSDNGRYAFRGVALDLWHGIKLSSFDETQRLAGRIDLGKLKLDVKDLGALDLGEGPEVVAFVDPLCPHCAALREEIDALAGTYRFRLVPIPVLGEASQRAVLAINCMSAVDTAKARDALLGKIDAATLPAPTVGCGEGPSQRALITAQILGIQGTPFLIAPDGRIHQGSPVNLATWIADGAGGDQ